MTLSIAAPRHTDTTDHVPCVAAGAHQRLTRHPAAECATRMGTFVERQPAPIAAPGRVHCLCASPDERFVCTAETGHADDHAAHTMDGRPFASWARQTPRPMRREEPRPLVSAPMAAPGQETCSVLDLSGRFDCTAALDHADDHTAHRPDGTIIGTWYAQERTEPAAEPVAPCGHTLCAPHGGTCLMDGRQYPLTDVDAAAQPGTAYAAEVALRGLDLTEQRARLAADAALATVPTHAPTTERERVWRDTYTAHLDPAEVPADRDRWTTEEEPQPAARQATDADRWAAIRVANGHPFAGDPETWTATYARALSARVHHLA
jgi:hypothetical protein